ncbi:MAG TPA: carboxypeptidase regulatory-like domain-containing protein [Candidatus Acidoferrales bacterium]|nr:carboxypeptidase regulatory-like domain-containing protein [Candidatus Acidoferrales bacterium]
MKTKYFLLLAVIVAVSSAMVVAAAPPAGNATISGKVTYTGTPPKMKPIDMSKEPSCAKQHATPVMTQNVVTGPGNALEYVVVYISGGDQGSTPGTKTVEYDQKGCEYIPHVAVMQPGQPLEIKNDDQTAHNIHPLAKVNQEWNKSQPPGTAPIETKYDKPERIPVKCNIHPWMHGYFVIVNTSHYAVTGNDGSFKLADLPAGKYTVTAWQEQYDAQSQEVTVGAGETKNITFTFKALPY